MGFERESEEFWDDVPNQLRVQKTVTFLISEKKGVAMLYALQYNTHLLLYMYRGKRFKLVQFDDGQTLWVFINFLQRAFRQMKIFEKWKIFAFTIGYRHHRRLLIRLHKHRLKKCRPIVDGRHTQLLLLRNIYPLAMLTPTIFATSSSSTPPAAAAPALPKSVIFGSSGLGGCLGWCVVHPANTIAVRSSVASASGKTFSISEMAKKQGWLSVYDGLSAGLARQIFYATSRFGLFETFRDILHEYRGKTDFASR